jgi:hypothetical protein
MPACGPGFGEPGSWEIGAAASRIDSAAGNLAMVIESLDVSHSTDREHREKSYQEIKKLIGYNKRRPSDRTRIFFHEEPAAEIPQALNPFLFSFPVKP